MSSPMDVHFKEVRRNIQNTPFVALPGIGMRLNKSVKDFSVAAGSVSRQDESDYDEISFIPELQHNITVDLVMAVFIACLSAFQVGYNTGVINTPAAVIRSSMIWGVWVDDVSWAIIVSVFCIGGLVGGIFGGGIADQYGRKKFMLANNVFFIVGGLLMAIADSVVLMAIGRLLTGIACGNVTVIVPLFLGEVSPAALRGTVGTLYQFVMVIGILVANLLGKPLGTAASWRYLLGITAGPAALQLAMSPFLCESPRWLAANGYEDEAKEVISNLTGLDDEETLDFHVDAMLASVPHFNDDDDDEMFVRNHNNGKRRTSLQHDQPRQSAFLLCQPELRMPLAIGLVLHFSQQLSGINAVFYYSSSFFQMAHVDDPWLGSVLAAGVNVLATGVAVHMMDRAGRRRLLLISSVGMFVSAVVLTVALTLMVQHPDSALLGYLSVVGVLSFVTWFELGLGPIPWLITAEIFPPSTSAVCMTVTCTANWLFNFLVGLTFPSLQTALGNLVFVPFATTCLLCAAFTFVYLPETRGKSLDQIQLDINGPRFPGLAEFFGSSGEDSGEHKC